MENPPRVAGDASMTALLKSPRSRAEKPRFGTAQPGEQTGTEPGANNEWAQLAKAMIAQMVPKGGMK